jgi:hypothetical protein
MTKQALQQELKEKVKAGVKPSDLKKLKRSKSADDIKEIPPAPPLPIVNDQLKEKQKEVEDLRKQLEETNAKLKKTEQDLDNSLAARVAGVKAFGQEHDKRTKAQRELNETIEEASSELITSDKQVSNVRTKLFKAQQEISKLQQELNREKLKHMTILPYPESTPTLDYFKYALYSLLAVCFMLWLSKTHIEKHS